MIVISSCIVLILGVAGATEESEESFDERNCLDLKVEEVKPDKVYPGEYLNTTVRVQGCISKIENVTIGYNHERGTDLANMSIKETFDNKRIYENTWKVHDTVEREYKGEIIVKTSYSKLKENFTFYDPIPPRKGQYSLDCSDYDALGYNTRNDCLRDGRWHIIGEEQNGYTCYDINQTINSAESDISQGAKVRVVFSNRKNEPLEARADAETGNDLQLYNNTGVLKFGRSNGGLTSCNVNEATNSEDELKVMVKYE